MPSRHLSLDIIACALLFIATAVNDLSMLNNGPYRSTSDLISSRQKVNMIDLHAIL